MISDELVVEKHLQNKTATVAHTRFDADILTSLHKLMVFCDNALYSTPGVRRDKKQKGFRLHKTQRLLHIDVFDNTVKQTPIKWLIKNRPTVKTERSENEKIERFVESPENRKIYCVTSCETKDMLCYFV